MSHIGSQVKRRQSQSYKFKEFAKISNFWILKQTLHSPHLLKLPDKMCTYEMDMTSWRYRVDTVLSIDGQTDRRTDRQTDRQGETNIPPFNFVEARGIISKLQQHIVHALQQIYICHINNVCKQIKLNHSILPFNRVALVMHSSQWIINRVYKMASCLFAWRYI